LLSETGRNRTLSKIQIFSSFTSEIRVSQSEDKMTNEQFSALWPPDNPRSSGPWKELRTFFSARQIVHKIHWEWSKKGIEMIDTPEFPSNRANLHDRDS
jgi:hypothetical protein